MVDIFINNWWLFFIVQKEMWVNRGRSNWRANNPSKLTEVINLCNPVLFLLILVYNYLMFIFFKVIEEENVQEQIYVVS